MSDRIFIDTNILVYAFDSQNPSKQKVAKNILINFFDEKNYFLSIQVINEFCSVAINKLKPALPVSQVNDFIASFPAINIFSVNRSTVLFSLEIFKKYNFSYWDSLIISTSLENGCSILYTEDLQNNQVVENDLRVVNPFI